eukprot:scaffold19122_cov162-Skeletonema_marinoi.AAC.7
MEHWSSHHVFAEVSFHRSGTSIQTSCILKQKMINTTKCQWEINLQSGKSTLESVQDYSSESPIRSIASKKTKFQVTSSPVKVKGIFDFDTDQLVRTPWEIRSLTALTSQTCGQLCDYAQSIIIQRPSVLTSPLHSSVGSMLLNKNPSYGSSQMIISPQQSYNLP